MSRTKNAGYGGRKGDWDRVARDDPVNKRIYDLFGLDSVGYCTRLAEIYRFQADLLEGRVKQIKTKQDLLTPDEFESIVRFQSYLQEEFNNIHVLPFSNDLGGWKPTRPIFYTMQAEHLDWTDPNTSLIPERNIPETPVENDSNSSVDEQAQRISDDFDEDTSTIAVSTPQKRTLIPARNSMDDEIPTQQNKALAPVPDTTSISLTQIQLQEVEPVRDVEEISLLSQSTSKRQKEKSLNDKSVSKSLIQKKSEKQANIEQSQRKQCRPHPQRAVPYPIQNIPKPVHNSEYFNNHFKVWHLPGKLPNLDTCRRRDFHNWLNSANNHKQVNQKIVDECLKFIEERRVREESSQSPTYSSSSKSAPNHKKQKTSEQNQQNREEDISYIRNYLNEKEPLSAKLMDGSPESNEALKLMFKLYRKAASEEREKIRNKKSD